MIFMAKKKMNYLEIALGIGIIAVTVGDVIPGDEVLGIPLGLGLIAHGVGYL